MLLGQHDTETNSCYWLDHLLLSLAVQHLLVLSNQAYWGITEEPSVTAHLPSCMFLVTSSQTFNSDK